VTDRHSNSHLSAETLQAFLDDELQGAERIRAEEHLAACAGCAAERDGWRLLFEELRGLPVLGPPPGFGDSVLAEVDLAPALTPALPWAARLRSKLAALVRGSTGAHPSEERLQELADGLLPARQVARVRTHMESCPACARNAAQWSSVFAALDRVGHLAPAPDFADTVMARVRVQASAPAVQPESEWRHAVVWVRRLIPQTRRAWATLSGIALTPAVTAGLVFWSVFTHPSLTPGALASFAWWKATAWASAIWRASSAGALESTGLFGIYSALESVALSPVALAGALVALSLGTVSAVWVLYKNLIANHPVDGHHAHVSFS
jgi:anti-sigma factor RsiW